MAKVNLYDCADLLSCAQKIGYDWNQANDILTDDEIFPMFESKTREYCLSEILPETNDENYGYSEDTCKILQAFFKQENITEFTIT